MAKHSLEWERISKVREGKAGLLSISDITPCPLKGGPVNPNSGHPGKIGPFMGDDGWGTCNGCKHNLGLEFTNVVCDHPNARALSASELARKIAEYEALKQAAQEANPQMALF